MEHLDGKRRIILHDGPGPLGHRGPAVTGSRLQHVGSFKGGMVFPAMGLASHDMPGSAASTRNFHPNRSQFFGNSTKHTNDNYVLSKLTGPSIQSNIHFKLMITVLLILRF